MLIIAGKRCFVWVGPTPRVLIMDPEMVKEIFNKNFIYPKAQPHPLYKLFLGGLPSVEGDTWAKHRRLLNPAFRIEKLKVF